MEEVEEHEGEHGDVEGEGELPAQQEESGDGERQAQPQDGRARPRRDRSQPGRGQSVACEHDADPGRRKHRHVERGRDRHDRAQRHEPGGADGQVHRSHLGHRRGAPAQTLPGQRAEGDRGHQQVDDGRGRDAPEEDGGQAARAVLHFARGLRERLEAGVGKEQRRQRGDEARAAVGEEGPVVLGADGEQPWDHEHDDRQPEHGAHRHLDPAEPADAEDVDAEEEGQSGQSHRLARPGAGVSRADQLEQVVRERLGEKGQRPQVGDGLEPNAHEGQAVAPEGARDVGVLAAGVAPERRRQEEGISDGGREDRGGEDEVTEDHAGAGEQPRLARDLEDAGPDQDADESGVRLDGPQVPAEARGGDRSGGSLARE